MTSKSYSILLLALSSITASAKHVAVTNEIVFDTLGNSWTNSGAYTVPGFTVSIYQPDGSFAYQVRMYPSQMVIQPVPTLGAVPVQVPSILLNIRIAFEDYQWDSVFYSSPDKSITFFINPGYGYGISESPFYTGFEEVSLSAVVLVSPRYPVPADIEVVREIGGSWEYTLAIEQVVTRKHGHGKGKGHTK